MGTEKEILEAVESVCSYLPSQYKDECNNLVETYGEEIIDAINKDISPENLCAYIGACPKQLSVESGPECQICQLVATELEKQLGVNKTEKEILKAVENVCSYLPGSYKDECDSFVDTYGQEIIAAMNKDISPENLCAYIGACPKQVEVSSDVSCDVCTFFATELDKLVTTNSTKEEIKDALEKACNILPSKSFVVECNALVDTYIDQIIEEIESGLSPKNICGASGLGLCTSSLELTQVQANPVCALCGLVMVQLVQQLEDGSTQAQVIAALDQVCKSVPLQPFADDCVVFVEKEAPEIISQIAKGIHPSERCQELRLCPATVQEDREVQKEKEIEAVEGKIVCELCSVVTHELDQLIEEDSTQDEIEAALDKVCSLLPADYVGQCDDLVARYKSYMVQILLEFATPQQLCGFLRLCPTQVKLGGEQCTVCTFIAVELDNMLADADTEKEITAKIEAVCSHLPSFPATLRTDCDQFVEDNLPKILAELAKDMEPKTICSAIHMCTATKLHTQEPTVAPAAPKLHVQGGELCQVCNLVIEDLDQVLAEDATKKDIENALDQVCSGLPDSIMTTCSEIVDEYTPKILDLAANIFQPSYVCKHIGLCGVQRKPALIGANPCSYGPSYWCNNSDSAKECNAVTFCMQHYW